VQDPEVHRHCVERGVVERQLLRVALDEQRSGASEPRALEHRRRDIGADRIGAARQRRLGDEAGAAGDVEEPCPGADAGRVEERLDEQRRVRPALLVPGGGPLPAVALELPELVAAHDPLCSDRVTCSSGTSSRWRLSRLRAAL
jgi:hypothetical protein